MAVKKDKDNLIVIEKILSPKKLSEHNIIWLGEIHGIKDNYDAYRMILPYLAKMGFKNILWEMRSDFSEKSEYTEDGRINLFSIRFLKWLNNQ